LNPAHILGLLGSLLVFAFLANKLFRLTRVPDVLVLMLIGVLVGPVLGWVQASQFKTLTQLLGTLAIILILFEGGLELELRSTLKYFPAALFFATLAYILSAGLVALLLWKWLLPLHSALLVGAVLGCTSSTVVLPVLQDLHAREPVRLTLMLESSWADMLAVLSVGALLSMAVPGAHSWQELARNVGLHIAISIALAALAGALWSRLLPILSEQRFWHILTFAVVLLLYTGAEALKANGLVAVLGFGIMLANFPGMDPRMKEMPVEMEALIAYHHERVLTFHSELAFLVRTFFFVLIGVVAELEGFRQHIWLTLGIIGSLIVARWISLQGSRWGWRDFIGRERSLILWMFPRGLITAVLAIQVFNASGIEFTFLPQLAFTVILITNVLLAIASFSLASRTSTDAEPKSAHGPAVRVPQHFRRRWKMDLALLCLLAVMGSALWGFRNRDRLHTWKEKIVELTHRR
jgi:cell volume regulation protein A